LNISKILNLIGILEEFIKIIIFNIYNIIMKYFLSACMIIKDERNLEELITYLWMQGVEHIYIYDNESEIDIETRLHQYIFKKICTVIYFPGKPQQVNSYNHCLQNYGKDTLWLYFLDGDEYILPKKHKYLKDFLKDYEDYHAIGINWVFFGTSFHEKKQDGFVIDKYRFTSNVQDQHIKTICKPEFTINCNSPHFVNLFDKNKYVDPLKNIISGPFNKNIGNTNIIQINHYYTRSIEESYEKEKRGRTDSAQLKYNVPHYHKLNNDFKDDLCANKYLSTLIDLYKKIHINWKIYKILNPDLKDILEDNSESYYAHFFEAGIKEHRKISIYDIYPNFRLNLYKNNYSDLKNMNDTDLMKHYIIYGNKENRICDKTIV